MQASSGVPTNAVLACRGVARGRLPNSRFCHRTSGRMRRTRPSSKRPTTRSSRHGSSEDGMDLHPDLTDLLGAFSSSNVEYLVVGGWAVSVHSEPRFTKDLDLLIGTSPDNLERAVAALSYFGPISGLPTTSLPKRKHWRRTSFSSSEFRRRESICFARFLASTSKKRSRGASTSFGATLSFTSSRKKI